MSAEGVRIFGTKVICHVCNLSGKRTELDILYYLLYMPIPEVEYHRLLFYEIIVPMFENP